MTYRIAQGRPDYGFGDPPPQPSWQGLEGAVERALAAARVRDMDTISREVPGLAVHSKVLWQDVTP